MVASTEVSESICVCACSLMRTRGFLSWFVWTVCAGMVLQMPPPLFHCRRGESSVTGWLQEISCEQRITCSIWPGSGEGAGGEESAMMHRAVCQLDGAHSSGPLSAFHQLLLSYPARALGVLYVLVCLVGEQGIFLYNERMLLWHTEIKFTLHLV